MINDDIKITVIRKERHHLCLYIEAPQKYEIWREEIYQKIKERERKTKELIDNG